MATKPTRVIVADDLITAARAAMGLPGDAPVSRVIRAAIQRAAGMADADGTDGVNRGGRPRGYSPKRGHALTSN